VSQSDGFFPPPSRSRRPPPRFKISSFSTDPAGHVKKFIRIPPSTAEVQVVLEFDRDAWDTPPVRRRGLLPPLSNISAQRPLPAGVQGSYDASPFSQLRSATSPLARSDDAPTHLAGVCQRFPKSFFRIGVHFFRPSTGSTFTPDAPQLDRTRENAGFFPRVSPSFTFRVSVVGEFGIPRPRSSTHVVCKSSLVRSCSSARASGTCRLGFPPFSERNFPPSAHLGSRCTLTLFFFVL